MRVTQVLYSGLGGHGSVVNSLIMADKQKKWQHQLVYYGIEELLPAYHRFCEEQNIPSLYIRKKKGFFHLPGIQVIKAFIYQKPDCIILHSPTLILPAWLFCIFSGTKLFVVEHTPHVTKRMGEKLASLLSLLLARRIVCLSTAYQHEFQRQVPLLKLNRRTVIIRNGINLDHFSPGPNKNNTEFHIGMAGRFTPQKNQRLILEIAIKGFQTGSWNEHIHFHFAGNGQELEKIQQWVVENKLEHQIHFHGLLAENELVGFFRSLDLYVHASFAETMCTTVMQAMACGLPVIGSDIPGINDLLTDDSDCLILLPNNEADKWTEHLLQYILQADMAKTRAILARRTAEIFFSAETTFDSYTKLILN